MKLSEWARQNGVCYKTAWRWWRDGQLPVEAIQMPSGTVLLKEPSVAGEVRTVVYARVSSHDQKSDLDAQVGRLTRYASDHGLKVSECVAEIGSGLNGKRKKLMRILRDKSVGVILVEHRDRLCRFGFEQLASALAAGGRRIEVANGGEVPDDIVRDMTEVLTSLCARLYGKRAAANKAKRALEAIKTP